MQYKVLILKEAFVISSFDFQNNISIKEDGIDVNEDGIIVNEIVPIKFKDREFKLLMGIYENASKQVVDMLNGIKIEYNKIFNRSIINHTASRIKEPKSILNKMQRKNLELNYKNLVNNINDIAGVRIICPIKDDIYKVANIIEKIPNWNLIEEKDYIKYPKKSGYSGYHMIVEVPVKVFDNSEEHYLKNQIFVKVEIQIRTMAMDFWAENEHRMRYKNDKRMSFLDSKRLSIYAKAIDYLDERFSKMSRRQEV